MAAIAVFGCFFWLQSLQFTASFDDVQSLSSIERDAHVINPTNFTHSKVFLDDATLDEVAILRTQHLGLSQGARTGGIRCGQNPSCPMNGCSILMSACKKLVRAHRRESWNFH